MNDRPQHECGVFGIYGHEDAGALTALGLHALQHRGQEAAGMVTYDGKHFHKRKQDQSILVVYDNMLFRLD